MEKCQSCGGTKFKIEIEQCYVHEILNLIENPVGKMTVTTNPKNAQYMGENSKIYCASCLRPFKKGNECQHEIVFTSEDRGELRFPLSKLPISPN